ncbi:MAG TPA: site-2 protease family protein [Bryobacteraceae bacterium]|jgi:Zn-dependent protease|nr:site-2 protease family protein [Bryobacteraceae bacterium]
MRGFNLFGVPVRLHFTFLLLVVFLVVTDLGSGQAVSSYALFLVGLFASVLLHETGHATVANWFGVRTTEIVMFPIGGLSRMERMLRPKEELCIAAAGPLVNVLLSAGIFAYMYHERIAVPITASDLLKPTDANVLARLAYGNLLLAGFNLLPAFPMDGGRLLRALLSLIRPEDQATRTAAWMGRMLAISMGLYGLLAGQFMLVFFAFFIYLGAAQESAAAMGRTLSNGIPVRAAMMTEFHTLDHGNTIRDAANLLLATSQQDFPVLHGDQVVGLLGRNLLLKSLAAEGPDAYVAGVMDREFVSLEPSDDLAQVLPVMARAGRCALVMDQTKLLGLLTTDNLSEFLLLRRFGMEPVV